LPVNHPRWRPEFDHLGGYRAEAAGEFRSSGETGLAV